MAVKYFNPAGLIQPDPSAELTIAQGAVAQGSRTIYLSGQNGLDEQGNIVAADLPGQMEKAYENIVVALKSEGATFDDVVRVTTYLAGWTPADMAQYVEGHNRVEKNLGINLTKPGTIVAVASLAADGLLVEVEVTAVIS